MGIKYAFASHPIEGLIVAWLPTYVLPGCEPFLVRELHPDLPFADRDFRQVGIGNAKNSQRPYGIGKKDENDRLTGVAVKNPMGILLRRYWMPALLSRELPETDGAPQRVRLLGEDLVAFRDTNGRVGLVDAFCPHRRAPIFFGRNEDCGIRCVYHGWNFDG